MKKDNLQEFNNNYNLLDANKSFFYVMVTNIIASIVFSLIIVLLAIIPWSDALYNGLAGIFQVITIPLIFLTFILLYHKKKKINIKNALNFNWKINIPIVLLMALMLSICIVTFFPLINMLYSAIERLGIETSASVGFAMTNWWQLLIGVAVYCLLPAIVEEIIFRGMILKGTLHKAKPYVAIIISAVAFFIMHGSLIQSFYQIILGFILSFIGYCTGNILYPIIFHFLNNLAVILISYFNVGGFINGFNLSVGGFFAGVGLFLAGIIAIAGIILLIRYLMRGKKSQDYELVVDGNNIIIEDNKEKFGFKQLFKSFNSDEKFYFYLAWIIAIVLWISNSF